MRKKPLSSLYDSYAKRSQAILSCSVASLPLDPAEMAVCEPVHQNGGAFLVVRLQALWAEFCRELIVRSAIGNCQSRTGLLVAPALRVKHVRDLPGITRQFTKQPFAGPGAQWEDPVFAIRQARFLGVSNLNQISIGLGSVTTSLGYLKRVRNFIVHPNRDTKAKYIQTARTLGFLGAFPTQLVNQHLPGGVTILATWVSDLEIAAWNAVA